MPNDESETISLRVGDVEITVYKAYTINSHFLAPTDAFHLIIGDEVLTDQILDLLVPGRKCQLLIDGAPQCSGYIAVVDTTGDRLTGNVVVVNGFDVFSPIVRSEIDPKRRYPEKLTLEHLLTDLLTPYGFTKFAIDNEDNRAVAANRALKQPKGAKPKKPTSILRKPRGAAAKPLKQYGLQKTRPHHGETLFQFLGRIMQRQGLWMWPNVQGDGIIVGKPNYDQPPAAELRRKRGGANNNIIRGGIVRDGTDQPSHIIATGKLPAREVQHSKMQVVLDNHFTGKFSPTGQFQFGRSQGALRNEEGTPPPLPVRPGVNQSTAIARRHSGPLTSRRNEDGSFSEDYFVVHQELKKWTTRVPAEPVTLVNPFASLVSTPKYVRDDESTTIDQLQAFARRQMSLHQRHAFVATYTIHGHHFDNGVIPQVDMVITVDDDRSRFSGPLWIVGRTFQKSRQLGTTTEIELLPLGALAF
jgi:prophage tail gpP-like protein